MTTTPLHQLPCAAYGAALAAIEARSAAYLAALDTPDADPQQFAWVASFSAQDVPLLLEAVHHDHAAATREHEALMRHYHQHLRDGAELADARDRIAALELALAEARAGVSA